MSFWEGALKVTSSRYYLSWDSVLQRGSFLLCSSELPPCSRTSLRSEVPGHVGDPYVLGFLGHLVKWQCQGFLVCLFDPWCWISKLPPLAFKDIVSSVLFSGINWSPHPRIFWQEYYGVIHLTLSYFLNFWAQLKKCVSNKCTGNMVKGRAGWGINQQRWAQPSMCLDVGFFLPSHWDPLCLLCLSGRAWQSELTAASSGLSRNSVFTPLRWFPSELLRVSCSGT